MIELLQPQIEKKPPIIETFQNANEGRDFAIYAPRMDAAVPEKTRALFPHFGEINEGDVIVDAGSGTGILAEIAAEEFHGADVYALDISHELREKAEDNRIRAKLVYGDAGVQQFPDNSVKVKYFSTSLHEILSFGGDIHDVLSASWNELTPGGRIVIRDFAKPTRKDPVYMSIDSTTGIDTIEEATENGYLDYSLLSTKALFHRFHEEFRGGNAFSYEKVTIDGKEFYKMDPEWAHEFYLRKDYTENWRQEIQEKYTYWDKNEATATLESAGFTNIAVYPNPNEYILKNRLEGKVSLFEADDQGELHPIAFPSTHMVVVAEKPQVQDVPNTPVDVEAVSVNYESLRESINYSPEEKQVTIDDQEFILDPTFEPLKGSKKIVFRLDGKTPRVLKAVRPDAVNDHAVFKAMYQSIVREDVLDEYHVPHCRILEVDPKGPPYRYFVQEAAPDGAVPASQLIEHGKLTEADVKQMAEMVNDFELGKKWQLDTNPFNWYKVTKEDGVTEMIYVDNKVYPYEESWEFRRIGLLQWIDAHYVSNLPTNTALIPRAKEYEVLSQEWEGKTGEVVSWWKKYLHPELQPK